MCVCVWGGWEEGSGETRPPYLRGGRSLPSSKQVVQLKHGIQQAITGPPERRGHGGCATDPDRLRDAQNHTTGCVREVGSKSEVVGPLALRMTGQRSCARVSRREVRATCDCHRML